MAEDDYEPQVGDWITIVPEVYQEGYSIGGLRGVITDTSSYICVRLDVTDVRGKRQSKIFKLHRWEIITNNIFSNLTGIF